MNSSYQSISRAITYIEQHLDQQPGLEQVAQHVGMSPQHLQRVFKRWAGVSPKRFTQYLTVEHAKRLIDLSPSLLETAWSVGLSGSSRLHDHFIALEAVSPGEYKTRGQGLEIHYGTADSPFGSVFLAATGRGVCQLSFLNGQREAGAVGRLIRHWPRAALTRDDRRAASLTETIFADLRADLNVPIHVQGTNFQIRVWSALLAIPPGSVATYGRIARAIGMPRASRAVGGALALNPVAYLIPCHRVIREGGHLGGYSGGLERKRLMLAWEAAQVEANLA
jgi:AraC family transcriptional regulator, regulatory protein of adaptative response / methylated-DNA-[protein]-cysteine methyltransferase